MGILCSVEQCVTDGFKEWCGEKALSGEGDEYLKGMWEGEELQSTDGNGKRLVSMLWCGTM